MPVFNCVAVRRAQRAAVEEQIAAVNLDDNKVILGERAALDVQTGELVNAVIADADKGHALTCSVAAVVLDIAALEHDPSVTLNVDDIVGGNAGVLCGVLTHNRAGLRLAGVLDRHGACSDCQCGLALFSAAVEGMTVQVKRHRLVDGDVLLGVTEQLDCIATLRRFDSCREGFIARAADLSDIIRLRAFSFRQRGGGQQAERETKRQQNG